MAAAAQHARAAAAASLKDSVRELTRYKTKPASSRRLLQSKLDKLLSDKDDLVDKHYVYADKTGKDLDSEELLEWLTPKLDDATDIADEVILMIETLETNENTQQKTLDDAELQRVMRNEVRLAGLQCQTNEKTLKDRVELMLAIVNDDSRTTIEDANLVRLHMKQVDDALGDLIKSWNEHKSLPSLTNVELDAVFKSEETQKKYVADSCLTATAFLNKIYPQTIIPLPRSASSSASVLNDSVGGLDKQLIKTEKMKYPTFDGDIRLFARFKSDFQTIIAPSYPSKEHQVYVLKESCLKGNAKKLVANMVDVESIWERLQDRYGNNLEIVNSVIKSVKNFQFTKNDHDRCIITLVDELERGIQDLSAIDAKHEIANAYTVKLLEEKMPRQIVKRWFVTESAAVDTSSDTAAGTSNKFDSLLEFLKLERKHAERIVLLNVKDPPKDPKEPKDPRQKKGDQFNGLAGGQQNSPPSNKCLIHPNASHFTRKCKTFLKKTVEERGKFVKENDGCKLCLTNSHPGKSCPFEASWDKCGISGCDEYHSRLVHGCKVEGISCYAEICLSMSATQTLLLIEYVNTENGDRAVLFYDGGSTLTLITKDCADRSNLSGVPVTYDLITVGGVVTTHNTTLYEITIVAKDGSRHLLQAFEIDEICGSLKTMNTGRFAKLFPMTKPNEIARPTGKVDILLGNDYAPLHPDKQHVRDGLVLYKSQLGTGKILGGKHNDILETNSINSDAHRCAKAQIVNVRIRRDHVKPALDFITTEGLGVQVPTRCAKCLAQTEGCKDCKFEVHELSRVEQHQLQVIRENLTLDPKKRQWTTPYACERDPAVLQNNKVQAEVLTVKTEKRLDKDGQRQTETNRDRQRQTETDRDRQRQTETDRDRQ